MLTKIDYLGSPIQTGCRIVYPVRKGSSLGMRQMKVERILADRLVGYNPDGRRISLQNWKTCVVVERDATDPREDDWFD